MKKMKMHSKDELNENLEIIRTLFPDAVIEMHDESSAEGQSQICYKLDIEALKNHLPIDIFDDIKDERYAFTWPGKKKAIFSSCNAVNSTLRPIPDKSISFEDSKNVYIEGDNLEALKLLQETYLNKIKMIYIDPPYNTGNDFVYNDDFTQKFDEYIGNSGQYDEFGNRLVLNPESNGRFHTDWLNMIYPRLRLARNLLADNGVIFISIDDGEEANLKKICDEIFGEDCFVANFVWKSRQNKDNRNVTGVSIDHEYILCYSKTPGLRAMKGAERKTEQYANPDNDPRGPWTSANMAGLLPEDQRPNCHYDLINPATGINYGRPKMGWRYDKNTMNRLIEENRIIWPDDPTGRPRKKSFLSEISVVLPGYSSIVGADIYTRTATAELEEILGGRYFSFPKPVELIMDFVRQSTEPDSIVLDFFSGSGTTAEAVMRVNAEDGGNRKFILIQIPEAIEDETEGFKKGYRSICDIAEDRIRISGKKIGDHNSCDTGMRVFKLDSSNMKKVYYTPTETQQTFLEGFADNIKPDRTPEDLLFQVMIDLGVMLSSKIEETEIAGKKVFDVAEGFLIACFDKDVTDETVKAIAQKKPYYAVFRDSSMANDSVATNFDQIFESYSPDTVRKVL